jgi:hypothetical protein
VADTSTKLYYFRGVAKWVKAKTPDKKYGHYTLDLYPDDESLVLFKDSGLGLKLREDADGVFFKLRREPIRVIAGDAVNIGPPKLFIKDENGEVIEFDDLIGNGSKVVAKVSVYPTQKGPGHRLESLLVEDLVVYNKVEVMNDEEFAF